MPVTLVKVLDIQGLYPGGIQEYPIQEKGQVMTSYTFSTQKVA